MAEWEEKIGAILGDPQAMGQIMALAQSLNGKDAAHGQSPKGQAPDPSRAASGPPETAPGPAGSAQDPAEAASGPPGGAPGTAEAALGQVPVQGGSTGGDPLEALRAALDPKLLEMGMRALAAYRDPDNSRAALLQALKPFVRESRYAKVDKAIQIAKLSKVVRAALDGRKGGEEAV